MLARTFCFRTTGAAAFASQDSLLDSHTTELDPSKARWESLARTSTTMVSRTSTLRRTKTNLPPSIEICRVKCWKTPRVSAAPERGTQTQVTWGNGLVDLDNDGDRDLFIACGHLYDNAARIDDRNSYRATNLLFANLGNGRFRQVTAAAGPGMDAKLSSRGSCFDDLDNDGDVDIVVLNARSRPTLLRNDSPSRKWLQIRLRGSECNRDGVGSMVTVIHGRTKQTLEVHSGQGYQKSFWVAAPFWAG